MNAESLINISEAFLKSHQQKSKNVYLLDAITPDVLAIHAKNSGPIGSGERPLLAVNKKIPGTIGGYGWSGLLITDKNLYYKCVKDNFFSSLIVLTNKGILPLEQIKSLAIGRHDACLGTAYIGHQLVINGKVVGLLRMDGGMLLDEKAINELQYIFSNI